MTGRIPSKGVQQHVDIRENHPRFSIMSRRAAESSRFTPARRPPAARDTGMRMIVLRRLCRGRARTRRSPRSIIAVNVSPVRALSFFAFAMSAGSRRTVVRICQTILYVPYVCQRAYASARSPRFANYFPVSRGFWRSRSKGVASGLHSSYNPTDELI